MMFAREWLARQGSLRQHLFPTNEANPDARHAICGESVPRGETCRAESAVLCRDCLLRSGSTVRLRQPVAA